MADDKSIVEVIKFFDRFRDHEPMIRLDVRAVDAEKLDRFDLADVFRIGNVIEQVSRAELGSKSAFRLPRGDCAARGDHEDFFHGFFLLCFIYFFITDFEIS